MLTLRCTNLCGLHTTPSRERCLAACASRAPRDSGAEKNGNRPTKAKLVRECPCARQLTRICPRARVRPLARLPLAPGLRGFPGSLSASFPCHSFFRPSCCEQPMLFSARPHQPSIRSSLAARFCFSARPFLQGLRTLPWGGEWQRVWCFASPHLCKRSLQQRSPAARCD